MSNVINLKSKVFSPPPTPEPPVSVSVPAPVPVVPQSSIENNDGTLRWKAPRAHRQGMGHGAYVVGGLLVIGGILTFILAQEFVTGILFLLLGIMTIAHVRRHIPHVDIQVTPLKIIAGTASYPYEDLKSFWVHYAPEHGIKELSLHMKKWHWPYVKIQLAEQDPVQVRAILLEYIPEEKHEEILLHSITRKLGM